MCNKVLIFNTSVTLLTVAPHGPVITVTHFRLGLYIKEGFKESSLIQYNEYFGINKRK